MDAKHRLLQEQVVVITGGASGIGLALARNLATIGSNVVVADKDQARLEQARPDFDAPDATVTFIQCDVTKVVDVEALYGSVLEKFGRVDILVNNAGFQIYRTFASSSLEELLSLVDVNLKGMVHCTKIFLPFFLKAHSGHIVNIASVAGVIPMPPGVAYAAAKRGVIALSEALQYELHDKGISVSVICPGATATALYDHPTFVANADRKRGPMVSPEEVATHIVRILVRPQFLTYVPPYYRLVIWLLESAHFIIWPIYSRRLRERIRTVRPVP
jgi:short-subunit dehydrogenase